MPEPELIYFGQYHVNLSLVITRNRMSRTVHKRDRIQYTFLGNLGLAKSVDPYFTHNPLYISVANAGPRFSKLHRHSFCPRPVSAPPNPTFELSWIHT